MCERERELVGWFWGAHRLLLLSQVIEVIVQSAVLHKFRHNVQIIVPFGRNALKPNDILVAQRAAK